jgi:Sugar (and other) transporter
MQFIIAKSTPFMIGMGHGTYFFFGAAMTVAFVWVWFLLPETKGLRLEEMDVIFGFPGSDMTVSKDDFSGQCDKGKGVHIKSPVSDPQHGIWCVSTATDVHG